MSEQGVYDWHRVHKAEENLGHIIDEWVFDHVMEWFGVDDVGELTEEQINEVDNFRNNELSEYSPLQWGFSSLYGSWESEQWEQEQ
tara:strand:- start:4960 stop:5217 length:258 start_codon:yes stop_codon:yes gene_type:complete